MSVPAWVLGAALALWGVSIGQPLVGVALAAAIETVRFARLASPIAQRTLARVTRITALAIVAALGYAAAARGFPQAIYDWLRWLPLVALPLPAMQRLSGGPLAFGTRTVETTHTYVAATLIAAGTGTGAGPWLYPAYVLVVGWIIAARAPRPRLRATLALLATAAAIGYGAHTAVSALQGQVEEWSTEFFTDLFAGKPDVFRERTRIGDLGRIRLSDRIVMRVTTPMPRPGALLLREAAFERYRAGEWQSPSRTPAEVARVGDRWTLAPGEAPRRLTLRRTVSGGEALLPLPLHALWVERLAADSVEHMPTGAVRARGLPRWVEYDAAYGDVAADSAPGDADLEVQESLAPIMDRVIASESLRHADPAASLAAIRAFFEARFAYSLNLSDRGPNAEPRTLADFLLTDRKGHCEYFATATVLLLRRAGIPARYVAGYSVQEFSPIENAFVVRGRHAHAWTQAFVGGRWIEVDTTPARWADLEQEEMHGWLGSALDRVSWIADRLVRWWLGDHADEGLLAGRIASALALGLLALGAAWMLRRQRARAPKRAAPDAVALAWTKVEASLAPAHARHSGETPRAWTERLRREQPDEGWRESLADLARAYYAARFDPAAIGADAAFIASAARWKPPA